MRSVPRAPHRHGQHSGSAGEARSERRARITGDGGERSAGEYSTYKVMPVIYSVSVPFNIFTIWMHFLWSHGDSLSCSQRPNLEHLFDSGCFIFFPLHINPSKSTVFTLTSGLCLWLLFEFSQSWSSWGETLICCQKFTLQRKGHFIHLILRHLPPPRESGLDVLRKVSLFLHILHLATYSSGLNGVWFVGEQRK